MTSTHWVTQQAAEMSQIQRHLYSTQRLPLVALRKTNCSNMQLYSINYQRQRFVFIKSGTRFKLEQVIKISAATTIWDTDDITFSASLHYHKTQSCHRVNTGNHRLKSMYIMHYIKSTSCFKSKRKHLSLDLFRHTLLHPTYVNYAL